MVGNSKELQGKRVFDELVDRDAAARFLELSPRTLDRWHLLHEGPPRKGRPLCVPSELVSDRFASDPLSRFG